MLNDRRRTLRGFVIAPAVPAVPFMLIALVSPSSAVMMCYFVLLTTYATAVLVGVPIVKLFHRFKITSLESYVYGGFVVGALPAVILVAYQGVWSMVWIAVISGPLGMASAFTFWMIERPEARQTHSGIRLGEG